MTRPTRLENLGGGSRARVDAHAHPILFGSGNDLAPHRAEDSVAASHSADFPEMSVFSLRSGSVSCAAGL